MATILHPGLHLGVPHSVYHSDPSERPSLSSHVASTLISKSPGHAKMIHPRFGALRGDSSDEMDTGSILHGLLLGGGAELVAVDADSWRTNTAKAARDEARQAGKIAVLAGKLERLQKAAGWIRMSLPIDLTKASTEATAIWTSQDCPCRCRIDILMPDLWIWDLKTCEDASVASADRNIAAMGYHLQGAANIDGVESTVEGAAGRVHFGLCFVEWENPEIGIVRKEVRGQLLDVGQRRWNRAKGIWARCLADNRWPGYSTEITEAQCPPWIAAEDMEQQIAGNAGGEPF